MLSRYLQVKIGTWPVYSFMLALGQIIASNSYQITLLTGEIGQSADKLYAIAGVYLAFSLIWGILTRYVKLLYLLTVPFFFYGLAFLLVGTSPFVQDLNGRFWMQCVATGLYAAASASGSLFFAFNFGDEGKLPLRLTYQSLLLTFLPHRRCAYHHLDLESVLDPSPATCIYSSPVVLGQFHFLIVFGRKINFPRCSPNSFPSDACRSTWFVDHWYHTFPRTAHVLPSNA
jgi:hypothetical protein